MALTMSAREVAISDIPCPADTRRDFDVLPEEGPALLVRLRLVGGGDGEGELASLPILSASSLLESLSEL